MRRNQLLLSQPYPVEKALKTVGSNLRTARTRRGLTRAEAAEKIGTGVRAVMDAEKGKAFTGVAVYAALLWLYDLLPAFEDLANPLKDAHGVALARRKEPVRARKSRGLSNDF
ncbi:MAG TPA: helix-turn-helix domain-containing protein [Terracidiphilus sp.]